MELRRIVELEGIAMVEDAKGLIVHLLVYSEQTKSRFWR